ncbi:MAG: hypothetical protein HDR54_02180 [Treponema sp.]|nr:hypothetical protein [Treponema sp.]
MSVYSEASYENAIMELFATALGYERVYGPNIKRDWHSPLYDSVPEDSIRRINPKVFSTLNDKCIVIIMAGKACGAIFAPRFAYSTWMYLSPSNLQT